MSFRQTDSYKKKQLRIKEALHRFGSYVVENNISSLGNEASALEELSLSTFSLMKAIRKEIEDTAKKQISAQKSALIMPSEPGTNKNIGKIIIPPGVEPFSDDEEF